MDVEKRYADWNAAKERAAKHFARKNRRNKIIKNILFYTAMAIIIVPLILIYVLSNSCANTIVETMSQMREDKANLRRNRHYY